MCTLIAFENVTNFRIKDDMVVTYFISSINYVKFKIVLFFMFVIQVSSVSFWILIKFLLYHRNSLKTIQLSNTYIIFLFYFIDLRKSDLNSESLLICYF